MSSGMLRSRAGRRLAGVAAFFAVAILLGVIHNLTTKPIPPDTVDPTINDQLHQIATDMTVVVLAVDTLNGHPSMSDLQRLKTVSERTQAELSDFESQLFQDDDPLSDADRAVLAAVYGLDAGAGEVEGAVDDASPAVDYRPGPTAFSKSNVRSSLRDAIDQWNSAVDQYYEGEASPVPDILDPA